MTTFVPNAMALYAQLVMDTVQGCVVSASYSDGIARNAAPYFAYGDVSFGAIPNTCPSVRMRSGDFSFEPWHEGGGLGDSGTEGTLHTEFIAHVVGRTEDEAFQEAQYLMFAVRQPFADSPPTAKFFPYPPINDIKGRVLDTGQLQKNAKRGYEVRWKAPISFGKLPIVATVTVLTASVTGSFNGSSLSQVTVMNSSSLGRGILAG